MWVPFVVLLALTSSVETGGKDGLERVINDVLVISRLVNGIAIQSESFKTADTIAMVVAELLGVKSSVPLSQLREKKVEEVKKDLEELNVVVKGIPSISIDDVETSERGMVTIGELMNGKQVISDLENGQIADPSQSITQLLNNVGQIEIDHGNEFLVMEFEELAKLINKMRGDHSFSSKEDLLITLKPLKTFFVKDINRYFNESSYQNFLNLKNISSLLNDVMKVGKMAELYDGNFDRIQRVETEFNTLSSGIGKLNDVVDYSKDLNQISQTLSDVLKLTDTLKKSKARRKYLTIGIPRGAIDLQKISEDLGQKFIANMIAGGRSTAKLKKSLEPLNKFSGRMKRVEDQWKKVFTSTEALEASKEFEKLLRKLVENANNAPKESGLGQSLSGAATCLKQLKKMSNDPQLANFKGIVTSLKKVDKDVAAFSKAIKEINQDAYFATAKTQLASIRNILDDVDLNNETSIRSVWSQVRNMNNLTELVGFVRKIHQLKNQVHPKAFKFLDLTNLTAVGSVMKSFENTNLPNTLSCLDQKNVDFTKIKALLGVGQVVMEINGKEEWTKGTNQYLDEFIKLKKELQEVSKNTWRGDRIRRATGSSANKLKNAGELSRNLGKGVEVLRQFTKIRSKEKVVMDVINSPSEVKSIVDKIPGSLEVWGDENQRLMIALLKDLQKFDESATKLPRTDLVHISAVFEEANKVGGVDIDTSFFADQILSDLSTAQFNTSAENFEQLSTLDLNFAQHHTNLKAASMSISQIQNYFDSFFGITRSGRGDGSSAEQTDLFQYLFIILGGLVVLALISVPSYYFGEKLIKKQYRWSNRERYWAHLKYLIGATPDSNLGLAIIDDRMRDVYNLMRKNHFINIYCKTATALHVAVQTANPEVVETMIKNGADRKLKDVRRRTAEQNLDEALKTSDDKTYKTKLKKCKEVFNKYRNMTFQPRVNDFLPVEQYSIVLQCAEKETVDFRAQFPGLLHDSPNITESHFVVDVDEKGVYDMDKSLKNDDMECYRAVFNSAMLVKSSWLNACVQSNKNFHKDYDYRVTKVRYNGKEYETVDEWKKWMSGRVDLNQLDRNSRGRRRRPIPLHLGGANSLRNPNTTEKRSVDVPGSQEPPPPPFFRIWRAVEGAPRH